MSGGATGALLAIFILGVFVLPSTDPGSFAGLFCGFFALATLSALIINEIWKRANLPELKLKILIPVGCITSIIPLFGPLFGLPNNSPTTLATIVVFGAIGGIFWSTPFALWEFFRGSGLQEKTVDTTNQTIIQNVTYNIKDSVVTGNMSPIENQDDENI